MADERVVELTGVIISDEAVVGAPLSVQRVVVTPRKLRSALGKGDVTLVLHSPGGDAVAGMAMAGQIRRHQGKVQVEVDGLAASAASAMAVSGTDLVMAPGAMLMLHEPHGLVIGNRRDAVEFVRMLDSHIDAYAAHYAAETTLTDRQARSFMSDTTWLTAKRAAELGIAKIQKTGRSRPAELPEVEMSDAWVQVAAMVSGKPDPARLTAENTGGTAVTMSEEQDPQGQVQPGEVEQEPVKPPVSASFVELELKDGTPALAIPVAAWGEAQAEITRLTELIGEQQTRVNELEAEKLETKVEALLNESEADGRTTTGDREMWRARLNRSFAEMSDVIAGLKTNVLFTELGTGAGINGSDVPVLGSARREAMVAAGWKPEEIEQHADAVSRGGRVR